MQATNPLLNSLFNQIHQWSEPEQNPMRRMFLTRISEVGCALIEIGSIGFKIAELAMLGGKQLTLLSSKVVFEIFPHSKQIQRYCNRPSFSNELKVKGKELCELVAGLASTLCIGILFSPEANFKAHLKLGLIIDNLAEKTQKKLAAKLQAELKNAEITAARKERFEKFEAEKQINKLKEIEAHAVESRLAELLLPQRS